MFIILSGAYVGLELEAEFGRIPPSFLPLANKRLFRHQVALAPRKTDVFISLPDSFEIPQTDRDWLDLNNIGILRVPENLTLGASLVAAINITGSSLTKPLHVLYGDTLYKKLPVGDDIISTSRKNGSYNWATFNGDELNELDMDNSCLMTEKDQIIDGYFKFSRPREVIKAITKSEWNFLKGINLYHKEVGMTQIESESWLDFGHVNTYYRSKADYTTQRAFNELSINSKWIEKSSSKNEKISAEANWFENIPGEIRGYTPQYLGKSICNSKVSYKLEYLHLTALNELFVFSKLPDFIWKKIVDNCLSFISECRMHTSLDKNLTNTLDKLFSEKTQSRLNQYCKINQITIDQKWKYNDSESISLKSILDEANKYIPNSKEEHCVLHGDFCFSNILYDFRADKIKTIDPRGIDTDGTETIYGDIRYDLAKLSHSIIGLYDWIIAGYYDVNITDGHINFRIHDGGRHRDTQQVFLEMVEAKFNVSSKSLYAMQIHLFLSMLPLHADDPKRQQALFANAFRLFNILVRLER